MDKEKIRLITDRNIEKYKKEFNYGFDMACFVDELFCESPVLLSNRDSHFALSSCIAGLLALMVRNRNPEGVFDLFVSHIRECSEAEENDWNIYKNLFLAINIAESCHVLKLMLEGTDACGKLHEGIALMTEKARNLSWWNGIE